ncbi:MAG: SirB2 family protein [Nitrosomonas sp.]|nr:SirB2 family protein [Nitrosomonas sp.]
MSYALLKMIHVGSIILSYLLFLTRGIWMMQGSANLQQRWVKILPHIIDTVLLTSAIALAVTLQQNPLSDSWLSAKVIGLLLYICLGMVAMRFGKTRQTKIIAWIAAQCVFIYIVLVALTKSPTMNLI